MKREATISLGIKTIKLKSEGIEIIIFAPRTTILSGKNIIIESNYELLELLFSLWDALKENFGEML